MALIFSMRIRLKLSNVLDSWQVTIEHLLSTYAGLVWGVAAIIAGVFAFLLVTAAMRWRMTVMFGVMMLVLYVVFISLVCLFEFNVFAPMRPPPCPRHFGHSHAPWAWANWSSRTLYTFHLVSHCSSIAIAEFPLCRPHNWLMGFLKKLEGDSTINSGPIPLRGFGR